MLRSQENWSRSVHRTAHGALEGNQEKVNYARIEKKNMRGEKPKPNPHQNQNNTNQTKKNKTTKTPKKNTEKQTNQPKPVSALMQVLVGFTSKTGVPTVRNWSVTSK